MVSKNLIIVFSLLNIVGGCRALVNCTFNDTIIEYDTHDCKCLISGQECKDGIIIPKWMPPAMSLGDKLARAFIYFVALLYLFLGVSILADRFMASIETITSQERNVTIKKPNGEIVKLTVRVWNETVSNLTLMALGSSAPEILLSVIEVCGNDFKSGELGPNTIVGSAAFNLFMIIAICVYVVPSNEIRRQQHLRVFLVTATWSVFAYVWLYLILSVITPGVIDIWEGIVTFLFFPITVLTAYVADRKLIHYQFLTKQYRKTKRGVLMAKEGDETEMEPTLDGLATEKGHHIAFLKDNLDPEVKAFEEHRREFMETLKDLRKKHPNTDLAALQQMAEYEMIKGAKKSRAFYRVQAVRKLTGGGNIVKKKLKEEHLKESDSRKKSESDSKRLQTCKIYFDPAHYTVLENVGTFNVTVSRKDGPSDLTVFVDYHTEDGSANAGSDYIAAKGTLCFGPYDVHLTIPIEIIDDDLFEEDEHFYIHLDNLRVKTKHGVIEDPSVRNGPPLCQIETPCTATVMILDDDHAGVFSFETNEYVFPENAGHAHVKVMRSSGARGRVSVPYKTSDGTAICDRDYEKSEGLLEFDNDEIE